MLYVLQGGIPQNHFVSKGKVEYFKFVPTEMEDLRITVTARYGDPDMYVKSGFEPYECIVGGASTLYGCGDYTWGSRRYSTDQILLSKDLPCLSTEGSTMISAGCDSATAYRPDLGMPVNIAVVGYTDAEFTIMVAMSGMTVTLLAGQPQLSTVSPGIVCDKRSPISGICDSSITAMLTAKKVLLSSFLFHISAPDRLSIESYNPAKMLGDTLISVMTQCTMIQQQSTGDNNGTSTLPSSSPECQPGCDCNPYIIYVNTCASDVCTVNDQFPSNLPGHAQATMTIDSNVGSTLTLSPSDKLCNPFLAKSGCSVYITVIAEYHITRPAAATFSLVARAPTDVVLIPCASSALPPADGIRYTDIDTTGAAAGVTAAAGTGRSYELCSSVTASDSPSEQLVVSGD
jgi:hypothetical protein